MGALPTDEEYLDELYARFKDDEWIGMQEQFVTVDKLVDAARKAIEQGIFKPDELDKAVEVFREVHSPSLYFRGNFIDTIRRVALESLKPYRRQLEGIPVGCLPTGILNATAFQTPRGGAVIVLDQGVFFQLGMLVRCYFAYYTWNAPDHYAGGEPYCHDHSRAAFGLTIQQLAAYVATGDLDELRKITTWKCPSLPVYDQLVEVFAFGIELFIMVHEFGHVVLNHFLTCTPHPLRLQPAGEVTLYRNSELQEFEADEFAFRHLPTAGLRPTDVAFSCGLLLNFFHLAELIRPPQIRTHPPALARWERIKSLAPLSSHPESWSNFLDATFASLAVGLDQKACL